MYPLPYPATMMPERKEDEAYLELMSIVECLMALVFHCTLMDLIPEGQGRHCCSSSQVYVAVDLP